MKQHRNLLSRAGLYLFIIVFIYAICFSVFEVTLAQGISGAPSAAQQISPQKPGTVPTGIRNLNMPVDDGKIMNVMSPTGQGMYIGTTVKIQWQWTGYENAAADVSIMDEVTQKGTIRLVGTIVTNRTGLSTSWAIPYTFPAGYYTIRVSSSKNPGNYSDYRIMVMKTTITVTSPNSGFTMATGSKYTIWWKYMGNPGPVKIELTNTSGSTPLIIAGNVPGGELGLGKFDWTIPSTLASTSGNLVRITSLISPSITADSQPFTISPPYITITSPQPGTEFLPAVYVPIKWTSVGNNLGSTVHITASPVGQAGTSLDVICPLSQGIYDQWIPMPLDGKQSFYIRVESTQNRSITAESGPVTILPKQSQPLDQRQGISPGN
jgi:hypothetical protein